MSTAVSKNNLIGRLVRYTGKSEREVSEFLIALSKAIKDELLTKGHAKIEEVGTLFLEKKKATTRKSSLRTAVNGELLTQEHFGVSFSLSNKALSYINSLDYKDYVGSYIAFKRINVVEAEPSILKERVINRKLWSGHYKD